MYVRKDVEKSDRGSSDEMSLLLFPGTGRENKTLSKDSRPAVLQLSPRS